MTVASWQYTRDGCAGLMDSYSDRRQEMADTAHGTSGGIELTEALIERLATEAKEGYDTAPLRPRTRRRGRPPIGSEAAALFQVRLEPELREALAQAADGERTSPNGPARDALRSYPHGHSP